MENTIAIRIKSLRNSLKMSQEHFSRHLGININTIRKWEQGKRKPDSDSLKLIADKTNITVDWLLGRTDKKNNEQLIRDLLNVVSYINKASDRLIHIIKSLEN